MMMEKRKSDFFKNELLLTEEKEEIDLSTQMIGDGLLNVWHIGRKKVSSKRRKKKLKVQLKKTKLESWRKNDMAHVKNSKNASQIKQKKHKRYPKLKRKKKSEKKKLSSKQKILKKRESLS
jgi:hypothetical protein